MKKSVIHLCFEMRMSESKASPGNFLNSIELKTLELQADERKSVPAGKKMNVAGIGTFSFKIFRFSHLAIFA